MPELERGEVFFIVRLGIFSLLTFKKAPAACEVRLHLAVINHIAACVNVNPHLISHLSAVMPGFQEEKKKSKQELPCNCGSTVDPPPLFE